MKEDRLKMSKDQAKDKTKDEIIEKLKDIENNIASQTKKGAFIHNRTMYQIFRIVHSPILYSFFEFFASEMIVEHNFYIFFGFGVQVVFFSTRKLPVPARARFPLTRPI